MVMGQFYILSVWWLLKSKHVTKFYRNIHRRVHIKTDEFQIRFVPCISANFLFLTCLWVCYLTFF